jgi:SAM-dependent methyltransferase
MKDRYFEIRLNHEARREHIWRELAPYIQARHLPGCKSLIDLGAGQCFFANNVKDCSVLAVDANPEFVEYAKHGVKTLVTDCLAFEEDVTGTFDGVFASNFFEHLEKDDVRSLLTQLSKILVPGGRLVVLQPNFRSKPRQYFDDYTHLSIWTDVSFSDQLRALGWRVTKVHRRFLPLTVKTRFPIPLPRLLMKMYLSLPFKFLAGQMLIVAEWDVASRDV